MSAFIVTDATISGMLQATTIRNSGSSYYYWRDKPHYFNGHTQENIQAIGQKLVDENYRSINYRYTENVKPHEYVHKEVNDRSAIEIIKLCNCYRYQTCETDDWEQTEAHAIFDTLRENAISNLPGYDEATWDLHYKYE